MLNDKVVVITGGAGLIGQEFVKIVAQNGGTSVIADIDVENAHKVKEQLSEQCQVNNIDVVELDINSKHSIQSAISYLDRKYHKIDALINNAYPRNKNYGKDFLEVEYQDFCENTNLHLGGYFLTSKQFIEYFIKQGNGNIVNMSSIYGVIAPKFEIYKETEMTMPVEYAVIKSALIHLTKYMAKYCQGKGIRINAISPGGILARQPQQFLNKYNANCLSKGMLEKQDLNGTLLYLLSDMSQYVNGQNIIIDDGFTL
jgi:NAD(P)-dependent dehydrogenase (short-subunit alcohol dehydrogenase family)